MYTVYLLILSILLNAIVVCVNLTILFQDGFIFDMKLYIFFCTAISVRRSVRPPLWARMKYLTILDGLTFDTNVHGSQMMKIIFTIFDFLIFPPQAQPER